MKKYIYLLSICGFFIAVALTLNINATTQQCIDYKCHAITLPLYLKILDFFDRYYNYKQLARIIVRDVRTDEECVLKIFEWTYRNIKKVPQGFPVLDDHIWYTIIRGYGARDQFSDIFATLCNHIGIESFFCNVYSNDGKQNIPLAFVKIRKKWTVFDPYYGIYFRDNNGVFAGIDAIRSDNSRLVSLDLESKNEKDYVAYLSNLPKVENIGLTRSRAQTPLNRALLEIKKYFK